MILGALGGVQMDMPPIWQGPEIRLVIIAETVTEIDTNTKTGRRHDLADKLKIIADILNADLVAPMTDTGRQVLQGLAQIVLPSGKRHPLFRQEMEIKGLGRQGGHFIKETTDFIKALLAPGPVAAAQADIQGQMDGIGEVMVGGQAGQEINIKGMGKPGVGLGLKKQELHRIHPAGQGPDIFRKTIGQHKGGGAQPPGIGRRCRKIT